MLEWLLRGLARRRVTTRYPFEPEPAVDGLRTAIEVLQPHGAGTDLAALCPTGAITVDAGGDVVVDRARCILCGACADAAPERFRITDGAATAARSRAHLRTGAVVYEEDAEPTRPALAEQTRSLGRSIHIRHVDAGSDGAEEWEIQALTGPPYDIGRLGLFFTAAPRHADILLVTGGVTPAMRTPLLRAYDVMPAPKAVVAAGPAACSGGLDAAGAATAGGVDRVIPVDVYVPGSPPTPIALLHGLLLAVGVLVTEVPA